MAVCSEQKKGNANDEDEGEGHLGVSRHVGSIPQSDGVLAQTMVSHNSKGILGSATQLSMRI